jgi:hypothetical protein
VELGRNVRKIAGGEVVVPDVQFGELPFTSFVEMMIDTQRAAAQASTPLCYDNIIHNDARAT